MPIRCGHCLEYHQTINEVKKCSKQKHDPKFISKKRQTKKNTEKHKKYYEERESWTEEQWHEWLGHPVSLDELSLEELEKLEKKDSEKGEEYFRRFT